MTVDLMGLVTREQLARLHPTTKADVMAYVRNQVQIVLLHADRIAELPGTEDDLADALAIGKTARKFLGEMETLFAERKPESIGHEGRE